MQSEDKEAQPLISIVVASYNMGATLPQCINSVLQQTYPSVELIVVDGGSVDGSPEYLKSQADKLAYWISEPDNGVYDAWNKGLAKASGDWICFLGADDYLWDEDVLGTITEQLVRLPAKIRVAYGKIMVVDQNGVLLHARGQPWSSVKHRFPALMSIPHPGTMHRSDLFQCYGVFDSSFKIAGDYELLLRELQTGDAHFLDGVVTAGVRQGGVSTDSGNTLVAMHEIRRAQKKQGISLPPFLWLVTISKVYIRRGIFIIFGQRIAEQLLRLIRKCPGLSLNWTELK